MTMNTDSLLQIYQTYSLEKINALSKKSLAIQYAQNGELVKLNKQLAANNAATNTILRNQIKELERQETVRFYKNLIFKMKLALDKIESQPIVNCKLFLSTLFLKPIEAFSKEAIEILDEIKDKEYAQQLIERAHSISLSNKEHQIEYDQSAWPAYLSAKQASENNKIKLEIRKKEYEINKIEEKTVDNEKTVDKKSHYLGCLIISIANLAIMSLCLLVFLVDKENDVASAFAFIVLIAAGLVWLSYYLRKKSYRLSNKEEQQLQQRICELNELKSLEKEKDDHIATLKESIKLECEDWEDQLNEIMELLPHELESETNKNVKYDSLFKSLAKFIVKNQTSSASLIQRKYAIGYSRVNVLMNQLEEAGIVGPANGAEERKVLVPDEAELSIIFEELKV